MQTQQIRWRDDAGAEADSEFLSLLLEGSRLLQQGEVQGARGRLEQALKVRPQNEKARNLLGQTYFKIGKFDDAKRLYLALVSEYPDEPTLRLNLALVHIKKSEMAAARSELEQVYALRPDHQKALNYLGLVYERLDELALARWAFRAAGNDKLASDMASKLLARGLPLEATNVPRPRTSPPVPASDPPSEVQLSRLPEPAVATETPPAPPAVEAAPPPVTEAAPPVAQEPVQPVEAAPPAAEEAPRPPDEVPPPLEAAPEHSPAAVETTAESDPITSEVQPVIPAMEAGPATETAPAVEAAPEQPTQEAVPVPDTTVPETATPPADEHVAPLAAMESSPPAPAVEAPPSSAAAAMPHLFRAMAAETAMAAEANVSANAPKNMAAGRTPLEWTASPTNDSMLMALSGDPMTGDQWVQRRGLPTVTRPFSPMTAGLLGLVVDGPVLVRALTVVATQGDVHMEPATRAGQPDVHIGGSEDPLLQVTGTAGLLTLDPGDHRVAVLKLDNSEATVMEPAIFGCSSNVRRQEGLLGAGADFEGVPAVRFSGVGVVAVRSPASVRAVPVAPGQPFTVSLQHLLAFEGNLTCAAAPAIPGIKVPAFRRSVTLQGTGVALLRAGSRP